MNRADLNDGLATVADKLAVVAELMSIEGDTGGVLVLQAAETRRGVHLLLTEAISLLRAAADTD